MTNKSSGELMAIAAYALRAWTPSGLRRGPGRGERRTASAGRETGQRRRYPPVLRPRSRKQSSNAPAEWSQERDAVRRHHAPVWARPQYRWLAGLRRDGRGGRPWWRGCTSLGPRCAWFAAVSGDGRCAGVGPVGRGIGAPVVRRECGRAVARPNELRTGGRVARPRVMITASLGRLGGQGRRRPGSGRREARQRAGGGVRAGAVDPGVRSTGAGVDRRATAVERTIN